MAEVHKSVEWVHQSDAMLNQVAPVQNVWYTVLNYTGRYTKIINIFTNILVANETLELEIIIDGVTLASPGIVHVFGVWMQTRWYHDPAWPDSLIMVAPDNYNLDLKGHNIRVRLRKTTALGAGNLQCRVVHALA